MIMKIVNNAYRNASNVMNFMKGNTHLKKDIKSCCSTAPIIEGFEESILINNTATSTGDDPDTFLAFAEYFVVDEILKGIRGSICIYYNSQLSSVAWL